MAITQTISSFPTAPSRENDTPADFSTHVDAYLAAVVAQVTEINTWATQANALETTVNGYATAASAHVDSAAAHVATALSYSNVALAAANYAGEWGDLTGAVTVPCCVSHSDRYWQLTSDLADVTAKEPGVDSEWIVLFRYDVDELSKTANYNVTAGDLEGGTIINNTGAGGEVIFQLPAVAAGYAFGALVTVAQYLQIKAAAGETIRYGASQSAANGYIRQNTIGRYVYLKVLGGEWVITDMPEWWYMDA